jgi:hypothetical protein
VIPSSSISATSRRSPLATMRYYQSTNSCLYIC